MAVGATCGLWENAWPSWPGYCLVDYLCATGTSTSVSLLNRKHTCRSLQGTPGARGSRSAAAAAPPVIPPTPHCGVGPRATARASFRPWGGPGAFASPWGALVGCGRTDTLQPGRGSGHRGHTRGGAAGARAAAAPTTTRAGRVQQGTGAVGSAVPPPFERARRLRPVTGTSVSLLNREHTCRWLPVPAGLTNNPQVSGEPTPLRVAGPCP